MRRLTNLECSNGKVTMDVMLVMSNSYTLLDDKTISKHAQGAWTLLNRVHALDGGFYHQELYG